MFKQNTAKLNHILTKNRLISVLLMLLFLSACEVSPKKRLSESEIIDKELRAIASPKKVLSRNLRLLKSANSKEQRTRYQLKIAEAQHALKQYKQLKKTLLAINTKYLTPIDKVRLYLLQAEYLLVINQARHAVKRLPKNKSSFPLVLQRRILDTQSRALLKAGYYLESTQANIALNRILTSQQEIDLNAQTILKQLSKLNQTTLQSTYEKQLSPELNTWINFIQKTRPHLFSLKHYDETIASWRLLNDHTVIPESVIDSLRNAIVEKKSYPKKIALMLPLTGRFSKQGKSVRDGIFAAFYEYSGDDKPEILIFDTSDESKSISDKIQLAKEQGCEWVVGPLTKQHIVELDSLPSLPLPTLALNYIDTMPDIAPAESAEKINHSHPLFQFGLLPEDEATQAARFALIRNQTNALVIVPDNNFGKRMADAFVTEYEDNGGHVLKTETYTPGAVDFGSPIKLAFNINQSHNRHSILQTVLSKNLKFEPRAREDVDVIYAITSPDQARSLQPQLKFHDVGDIPVLSNSRIYNGNNHTNLNKDINDVVFTHMPWTLNGTKTSLRKKISAIWPTQLLQQDALYALGADTFNILPFLSRMQSDPLFFFSGHTGNLSIDDTNQVHRELLWAKFEEGVVVLVDSAKYQIQPDISSETQRR